MTGDIAMKGEKVGQEVRRGLLTLLQGQAQALDLSQSKQHPDQRTAFSF